MLDARTRKLGIGNQSRQSVRRQLNFGHNGDSTRLAISDNLAHVILCVKSAVTVFSCAAKAAYFRKFRVGFYLKTPATIINQMQMQHIHLVCGHDIQVFEKILLGEPIAGDIKHHAAPRKSWSILDSACWNRPCPLYMIL